MTSETISKEARALPFAEQIELGRNLWDDIVGSHELAPGEAELIDRRLQDHLDNPNDVVSWEEVKAKLDAKYHACLTSRKV
jgi:putative addiction module component (TIGR02574 family)